MLRDKIGDDQMSKFIVFHTLSCFEFHKKGVTLLYKQQIKTEYTSASELLYVMNQLQVGNSTYEDEYLLSTHLDYIFMEIITYTLNVLEKLCQQNSLHSSFTF